MAFDPVDHAQTRLMPFLNAILELVAESGEPDQTAFFGSIRRGIEAARHPDDLADPFMQLSMSAFLGFQFQSPVAMILDQLLMHAQELTLVMSLEDHERN